MCSVRSFDRVPDSIWRPSATVYACVLMQCLGYSLQGLSNLFIKQKPPSVGALCLIKGPGADLWLAAKANIRDTIHCAGSSFINKTCHKAVCVCVCLCSSARLDSNESVTRGGFGHFAGTYSVSERPGQMCYNEDKSSIIIKTKVWKIML